MSVQCLKPWVKKANIMTAILCELSQKLGPEIMQFHAPFVWLYRSSNKAIVIKIETTTDDEKYFVNASFARDGSGPLMASFMSMLMIEDVHATSADTIGICSGEASVTFYHMLDLGDIDDKHLVNYLYNFEILAICILEQATNNGAQGDIFPPVVPIMPVG